MDTVIIPCAGAGSRLGLAFPKELLPVAEDRTAIDTVFDLLLPHAGRLRVLIVIDTEHGLTIRHLARYVSRIEIAFVFQQPHLPEVTGAVRSALDWAGPRSLVLLPDQVLHTPESAAGIAAAALDILVDASFCFLAATESDPDRIGTDGALRLEPGPDGKQRVTAYADKPGTMAASGFNAVWFGYGFRRDAADAGLEVLHRSTSGEPVMPEQFAASPLAGCPALEVGPFTDIGTWTGLITQFTSVIETTSQWAKKEGTGHETGHVRRAVPRR